MILPITIRPEAADDMIAARAWYEARREGLGSDFTAALSEKPEDIAANPHLHAAVLREVRPAKLRRFPYVIYYRILGDRIEVLGVLHGSRDPRIWQKRS